MYLGMQGDGALLLTFDAISLFYKLKCCVAKTIFFIIIFGSRL